MLHISNGKISAPTNSFDDMESAAFIKHDGSKADTLKITLTGIDLMLTTRSNSFKPKIVLDSMPVATT
jgi:hypothetical protein